jgi:hypothetical protein
VVDTFDQEHEAKLIAEDALATVATSLAVEVGAVGIGTLVTVLATTAAVDVTGIVTAGIIAALGLFIIPTRRRMAKQELSQKIAAMRTQLIQSLTLAFDRELGRSQEQIRSAVAPYDRFVRAESGKLQESKQQFDSLKTEIERQIGAVEQI